VADWQTISSLATAGGTLVLARATFSAVRSSNRSARVAERALLAGMRPLLVPSLSHDPDEKVIWRDRHVVRLSVGRAIAHHENGVVYLAISLRDVGAGLALLHSCHPRPPLRAVRGVASGHRRVPPARRRPLHPPAGPGYWETALRDEQESLLADFVRVVADREPITIDLLHGDQESGQWTISRCPVLPASDGGWYSQIARHWNIDRAEPR
jgi:hypothetical protein